MRLFRDNQPPRVPGAPEADAAVVRQNGSHGRIPNATRPIQPTGPPSPSRPRPPNPLNSTAPNARATSSFTPQNPHDSTFPRARAPRPFRPQNPGSNAPRARTPRPIRPQDHSGSTAPRFRAPRPIRPQIDPGSTTPRSTAPRAVRPQTDPGSTTPNSTDPHAIRPQNYTASSDPASATINDNNIKRQSTAQKDEAIDQTFTNHSIVEQKHISDGPNRASLAYETKRRSTKTKVEVQPRDSLQQAVGVPPPTIPNGSSLSNIPLQDFTTTPQIAEKVHEEQVFATDKPVSIADTSSEGMQLHNAQATTSANIIHDPAIKPSKQSGLAFQSSQLFGKLIDPSAVSLAIIGSTIGLEEKRNELQTYVSAPAETSRINRDHGSRRRRRSSFNDATLLDKMGRWAGIMKQQAQKAFKKFTKLFDDSDGDSEGNDETYTFKTYEYESAMAVPPQQSNVQR